jgi:hypothetical protein
LLPVDRGTGLICSTIAVAGWLVACGAPADPAPPSTSAVPLNPARIERARGGLPAGYEVSGIAAPMSPAALWGIGAGSRTEPPQCAVLADPVTHDAGGWSASGAGGIVHAVVAGGPPPDPAVLSQCGRWVISGGRTTASVSVREAPRIDGAATVAMTTAATTEVEGGVETHAHAETATAYLDGYVVYVTVVTDPGSPNPQLGQDFADEMLVTTVSALRG